MQRVYQVTSLVWLGAALFMMAQAREYTYYTPIGPGAGFFPFWLSVAVAILSIVWLIQVTRSPNEPMPEDFIPNRIGGLRIVSLVVALLLLTVLMDPIGFRLSMLAFLLFVLVALGRQHPLLTVAIALAGSFGLYHVFVEILRVDLPAASIEFLNDFGM